MGRLSRADNTSRYPANLINWAGGAWSLWLMATILSVTRRNPPGWILCVQDPLELHCTEPFVSCLTNLPPFPSLQLLQSQQQDWSDLAGSRSWFFLSWLLSGFETGSYCVSLLGSELYSSRPDWPWIYWDYLPLPLSVRIKGVGYHTWLSSFLFIRCQKV